LPGQAGLAPENPFPAAYDDCLTTQDIAHFDGQIHTFISLGGIIDDANVARSWLGERLREAFTA
jgi:hypothetical protein